MNSLMSFFVFFQPTNFSNPMYDTLYNDNAGEGASGDSEKKRLLKDEKAGDNDVFPADTSYA